ncbi:piggyBac transposable element-derived protein 4-like [Osmia bicornis bicornis]|uniref:piggyBac transposable element-derived protein 4-like n=1 Tax=Osmia bicornis bicornis TaxID=1437191 RepID=UPI001EAEC544|nr:piggyBac transposable element-derived protein 4-like [Osmia bicornis bicornis]
MSDSESEYANLSQNGSEESDSKIEIESEESDDNANLDLAGNWYVITNQFVPAPPRYPFIGAPGCTFAPPEQLDVFFYYQLFFDDSLINHIVTETNKFAQQQRGLASRSWSPVTFEEMHVFLAMTILQGIVIKPEERMYWTTSELFETPIFSKLFPYRRKGLDLESNSIVYASQSLDIYTPV